MSYDHRLLFGEICLCLQRNPCCTLAALSTQLHVSSRTIQKAIFINSGKSLRELREEILIARLRAHLLSKPTSAIKELSFDLGYKSPRSFARAIRRAYGISPEQLRCRISEKTMREQSNNSPESVPLAVSQNA
jgi:AraC-like DNA-binding protein